MLTRVSGPLPQLPPRKTIDTTQLDKELKNYMFYKELASLGLISGQAAAHARRRPTPRWAAPGFAAPRHPPGRASVYKKCPSKDLHARPWG